MSTDIIQVHYDDLATIASRFGQQMEATSDLHQRMMQSYRPLEQGGWQGQGAAAFCDEMQGEVFPAMQRLIIALSEAQTVTLQVRDIIRQAEEEAASLFGGDGTGVEGSGAGGSSGATSPGTTGATLPMDQIFNESYMNKMISRHWKGEGSDALNKAMHTLQGNPSPEDVARALKDIAEQRDIDLAVIEQQYQKFKELQAKAIANGLAREDPEEIAALPDIWDSYMGSRGQLRYGQIVGNALGLDPVFGALLNPTGGMPGPGAFAIPASDTAIAYHSAFHDAGGFLKLHFDKGPGFDYLGREGHRPDDNPFTGQESGLQYWNDKYLNPTLLQQIAIKGSNIAGSGMGAIVDVKTGIDTIATEVHAAYEDTVDYIGNATQDVAQDVGEFFGNLLSL